MLLLASAGSIPLQAVATSSHASTDQKGQGYLGIEFHDVLQTGPGIFRFRPAHQVEIVMVDHDGPAGKAGLKSHDVVQSLNGQSVTGAESLRQMIHDAGAGATITLIVMREGHAKTLTAFLENREEVERRAMARVTPSPPDSLQESDNSDAPGGASKSSIPARGKHFIGGVLHGPSTGLQLEIMPSQLALYFGVSAGEGLLVASVDAGSPAALAGLQAGDVLLRADSASLHSVSDWNKHLHASKGRSVSVLILREHHEMTLTLQAGSAKSTMEWPFHF